jgi:hypothetical protein
MNLLPLPLQLLSDLIDATTTRVGHGVLEYSDGELDEMLKDSKKYFQK